MSVTAESDPSDVFNVTVAPPVVRLFPLISLACTVIVVVLIPFAAMEASSDVIVEVVAEAGPGTKVTTSLSVIATPPSVPVIVAVPVVVEDVKVAV